MFSVSLQVNSRLLIVKSWGSQSIHGFAIAQGISAPALFKGQLYIPLIIFYWYICLDVLIVLEGSIQYSAGEWRLRPGFKIQTLALLFAWSWSLGPVTSPFLYLSLSISKMGDYKSNLPHRATGTILSIYNNFWHMVKTEQRLVTIIINSHISCSDFKLNPK